MHYPALKFCTLVATITATIAFLLPHCSLSQATTPATAPASPPPALTKSTTYAEESIVIEHSDSVYTFAADGTGTQDHTIVARVQSDAAVRSIGVVSVAYAANSQQVEFLYAHVRHPDGTVVETPPADAIEMPEPVTREAPLYSDLKEKQLPIRSLRVGDTLEWKARITTTKSQAPGEFWGQESFTDDAVVLSETLELRVPVGIFINVWSPTAKPVESTSDGQHVYRWTFSQLRPTAGKAAVAEAEAKNKVVWTADQEIDADQGKLPSVAWTTFKSWEEVGAWYRSLEADRVTPAPEIRTKVAELIAGKSTDEEKVRALYAYVATQIRYIGVDFGIGRYQPHTASEILSNQYGDCKDKHTLLAAMLSATGIQSDAVLIGAGIRFNPAVPSPGAFNHLITHLTLAGQPVWLDTTTEIAPYRMLVPVIRDKQALVVPATVAAHLDRTPADPPFASFQTMDAVGTLDKNGVSHSRLTLVVRGDVELALRAAFHQTAPAQFNELVQQIVHSMGYAGTSSNADVTRPEDTTEPFKMSYDYEREKAGDWENYKIIPQVAPVSLPRFADSDPLVRVLDLGYPHIETSKSAITIPEGWGAILPEAVHYKCPYATYDETYRFEKGSVYAERRVEVVKQKVPTADLATYKKWANDADLGDELYIQLVRHDDGTPAGANAGLPPDPASITDVTKLLQQAYADIEKMDLYNAKDLLDQARKLSPDHEYLWNTTGYLRFRNGEMAEALVDYKKELALHPAAFQRMYPVIIHLQLVMDQRKDATDSLRAWSKSDPVDPAPVEQLLSMLIEDGDAKTAIFEGEAALARLPGDGKNDAVYISVGQAYLMAGDKQKGAATLRKILQESHDPGAINDSAYILADATLELPLAEASTRTAIDQLTEESNSWTLDENPQTLHNKSRLIVAAWDTLGWTLFREGKPEQAQPYLQAAWIGLPNIDTGKHLGDLYAAGGNKSAALTAYELAIATEPGYNALGVRTEPSDKQKKLQEAVDELRRGGAKSTAPIPGNKLLELRTIPLDAAKGRSGQAEYRILLKDGKAIKTEPTGDKSVSGAPDMIANANFTSFFPAGSHAAVVRTAYVNCHSKVCELILEPLK
jgi:tetratricopeptide (TPR) repeat protein